MSTASGLEHLKPFLPGLESALEDSEVSEIMINGPGNVWVERAGRLAVHAAPDLDEAAGPRPVLCGSADTPENARPWAAGERRAIPSVYGPLSPRTETPSSRGPAECAAHT